MNKEYNESTEISNPQAVKKSLKKGRANLRDTGNKPKLVAASIRRTKRTDARSTRGRSTKTKSDRNEMRARCEALLPKLSAKKHEIRHPNETLLAALKLHQASYSFIPVKLDGSKSPALKEWKPYQKKFPTTAEVLDWYDRPNPPGIGIIHGLYSGGSEAVDIDDPELVEAFEKRLEEVAPGLLSKLIIVRTPREDGGGLRGRHYYYTIESSDFSRYGGEDGNQKLAERRVGVADVDLPRKDDGSIDEEVLKRDGIRKDEKGYYFIKTLIETRGERGYTIAPGSPAKTHATGRPYELLQGSLDFAGKQAIRLTFDERATILECAHSFNEYINPKNLVSIPRKVKREDGDIRPGEAYDQSPEAYAKTLAILEDHGWQHHSNDKHGTLLTRPGKRAGVSARLFDNGVLYVFSSNAQPFDAEQAYTPFAVLAYLEHNGDFSACAKALYADDYGDRAKSGGSKPTGKATSLLGGKIKLDVEAADRGRVTLTAWNAYGTPAHQDTLDIRVSDKREAFIKALKLNEEGEREEVRQAMLKIATTPPAPREAAPVKAAEARVMSKILSDGRIIEQLAGMKFAVYDPQSDSFDYAESVEDGDTVYKPRDLAVDMALPEKLTEYGTEAELDRRIEEVYRRYCDAPDSKIKEASKYVRLTFAVDLLNVLPYLKATGEGGSGKSRFCRIGVKMSYHPVEVVDITKAVLFRLVDECKPTLFIDEFNPDTGGEDTEGIIQVLNAGFQRGANVYRTEEPDADGKRKVGGYSPFGAKFLAGLKSTGSQPFESRCVEVKLQKATRRDIRFRDTPKMFAECSEVAESLYLWRLRFLTKSIDAFETMLDAAEDELKEHEVDPRYIQIATPLYALIEDEGLKKEFVGSLEKRTQTTRAEKQDTFDGKLVRTVYDAIYDPIYDDKGENVIDVKLRKRFVVDEPIYEATIGDLKNKLIAEYPELKDGYIGKKLGEVGFSKAKLTKRKYNGEQNAKREQTAVVFEPETLKKIFVNYGLPLPGDAVPTQPELVNVEDQTPWKLDKHPERIGRGKGANIG